MNGELVTSDTMLQDYKPIEYAEIPSNFDQMTHYIVQSDPINEDDHIFVGIEIHELEIEDEEFDEDVF